MTEKELIKNLKDLSSGPYDPEVAHGNADDFLLSYIDNADVTEAFSSVDKWYA